MAGSKEVPPEAKPAAQANRLVQQLCSHLLRTALWTNYIQDPLTILKMLKQQQIQVLNDQTGSITKFVIESIPMQPMRKAVLVKSVIHKIQATELERLKHVLLSVNGPEIKDQIIRLFDRITQHLVLMGTKLTFLPPVGVDLSPCTPSFRASTTFYVVDEGLLWSELFEDIAQAGDIESLHDFLNKPGIQSENVWLSAEKDSPFHASIESGHITWCRTFIKEIMACEDRKFERACPFKKIELVNLGNIAGNTALHLAVRKELFPLVQCLLSFGANPYIPNCNGTTPLDLMYERLPEGVLYLLTVGSASNSAYRMSRTGQKDIQLEIDFGAIVSRHDESEKIGWSDYLRPGRMFSSCYCPTPSAYSRGPKRNVAAYRKTTDNTNNLSTIQIIESNDVHVKGTKIPETASLLGHAGSEKGKQESIEIISADSPASSDILQETEDSKAYCPRHNKSPKPEMELLARVVYTNWRKSAKPILSHVVAKTFLDLKWKTLKTRVYILTLFYMFTYLNQMAFVAYMHSNKTMPRLQKDSMNVNETVNVFKDASNGTIFARWDYTIKFIWSCTAASCLGIFGWFEVFEFIIIARTFSLPSHPQTNGVLRFLSNVGYKICFYLNNIENALQLPFFVAGVITVFKAMEGILTGEQIDEPHEFAAWSAVLAGILVLFQMDNFEFDGAIYVQIFKVVLGRFVRALIVIFVCISAGYCVAFSVIMKQEIFALPMVIFRAISMMAGEFNYDAIFDPKDPQTSNYIQYYNSQMIFASFTIIITIFLVSLLVGLAVDDIKQTRVESEDILRRVRVNRMFILERLSAWWGLNGEGMFVLPSCSRRKNSPCLRRENLRELSRKLHKEWRLLCDDGTAYHREHFWTFFQFSSEFDMGGRQALKSESLVA